MKVKTRFLALLFIIISVLASFVGCDSIKTTLSAPTNVRIESGYVKWNSVDGAMSYLVYVDDDEYSASGTSFDLSLADNLEVGKSYAICVKAKGDGYLHQVSDPSKSISYTHTQALNNNNNNSAAEEEEPEPEPEPVTDESVANKIISLGLGCAINTLTAEDVTEIEFGRTIFKDNVFSADDLLQSAIKKTVGESKVASSYTEAVEKLNYGLSASANLGYASGMFTAGFESKFGSAKASSVENMQNQYYYQLQQSITGQNYFIKNFGQTARFQEKLSEFFLADLDKVRAGTKTADAIFKAYGTHAVMTVSYGAMIEVNYAQYSSTTIEEDKIKESIDLAFSAGYGGISGGVGFAEDLEQSLKNLSSTGKDHLKITAIGGNLSVLNTSSFTNLAAGYNDWIISTENQESFSIIGSPQNGLMPIWDYLPDEYSDVAKTLENAFIQKATENADRLAGALATEKYPAWTIKTEKFSPQNCQLDNGYNPTPTPDKTADDYHRHDGWEMVDLNVYGCNQKDDNYVIANPYEFSLKLKIQQDYRSLPDEYYGTGPYPYISDDSATSVYGTNILSSRVGYGAYYVRITYTDHQYSQAYASNLFKNTTKGNFNNIVSVKDGYYYIGAVKTEPISKKIETIDVVVVYEFGIYYNIFDTEYTNWRCEKTLNFEYTQETN